MEEEMKRLNHQVKQASDNVHSLRMQNAEKAKEIAYERSRYDKLDAKYASVAA
jgi:hypothetical protein